MKKINNDLKFEIECRELLLKKMSKVAGTLSQTVQKEKEKRAARIESFSEYKTEEEAHEAFGYGSITEEEYRIIADQLESNEQFVDKTVTKTSAAFSILNDFIGHLQREIRDFKWEALPDEEKERIQRESEERRTRVRRLNYEK